MAVCSLAAQCQRWDNCVALYQISLGPTCGMGEKASLQNCFVGFEPLPKQSFFFCFSSFRKEGTQMCQMIITGGTGGGKRLPDSEAC